MTLPRQFLQDSTYLITRRTTPREFWLKPTKLNTQIFLYCIAVAAEKTGVQLHAICVMSNHWHVTASDPHVQIAAFYEWVHKYVAKAINCSRGRGENLWSSEKTSVVELMKTEDIIDKVTYTLCNPVSAHLVAKASNWPGVWLYKQEHFQAVKRPEIYFKKDGDMPDTATLNITKPSAFSSLSTQTYEKMIEEELSRREHQIADEMHEHNQTFMGVNAVMAQSYNERPPNFEPRRELNPRIAAKDKRLRISAIRRYKHFIANYKEALEKWNNGNRDVIFPPGTYAQRIHAGVNVQPG